MSPAVRRAVVLAALLITSACADRSTPLEPPAQDITIRGPSGASEIGFTDRGLQELKGLSEPRRIYLVD